MDFYVIEHYPNAGTCWIKGVGKDNPNDRYGSGVRADVDEIRDQISQKYGEPKRNVDFLRQGSIWNEPEDWGMAVKKNERFYGYIWEFDESKAKQNVVTIYVGAAAVRSTLTYPIIEISFKNKNECEEAEKEAGADAF